MELNLLREAMTVISFGAFVGVVVFAVHPANRKRFEEAARLPLDDEGPSPQPSPTPYPLRAHEGEGANAVRGFAELERN